MSMHPTIMRELAERHRQDLLAQAADRRRVRAALDARTAPASTAPVRSGPAARIVKAVFTRSTVARRPLPDEG
ncbi:MAG TPA: hypothetical protein VEH05_12970 [Streptosporangiaceae bacterium]|nr:hypothetical protein [Streptosporangiaceae bacterium]